MLPTFPNSYHHHQTVNNCDLPRHYANKPCALPHPNPSTSTGQELVVYINNEDMIFEGGQLFSITLFLFSLQSISLYERKTPHPHPHSHPPPIPMLSFKYKGLIFQALYLVLVEYAASQLVRNNFTTSSSITRSREVLAAGGCNLFQGRWVVDPSYPLYESSSCPFIDPEFDCIKYGRPDKQYLKFSWKPDSCDLPRYVLATTFIITFVCVSVRFHFSLTEI